MVLVMCDQGWLGMGKGLSSPTGSQVEVLLWEQVGQVVMKEQVSASVEGHQK